MAKGDRNARRPRSRRIAEGIVMRVAAWAAAATCGAALAQDGRATGDVIDACGTLVRGAECVLFETGGARYVLAEFENFKVGDAVRVVGTLDLECVSICQQGDGCIRGATLYDPAVLPCGEPLPSFPGDVCTGAAGALTGLLMLGLALRGPATHGRAVFQTHRSRREPPSAVR